MLNNIEIIVLGSVFVILLVVIFKPVQSAFKLDTFPSCVISVCVSVLCVIGMQQFLNGSMKLVLLPYAALAICIILSLLIAFLFNMHKKVKDKLEAYKDGTGKPELRRRTNNERMRR